MVRHNRFLPILSMALVVTSLACLVVAFKIFKAGPVIITGSSLLLPLRYFILDIIAEIYGYYQAKRLLWIMLIFDLFFAILVASIIKLPSPAYWTHDAQYHFVLGNMPHILLAALISIVAGSFINIYLISRWKLLWQGKHFLARSLSSSIIGELLQYFLSLFMIYFSHIAFHNIFSMFVNDYLYQVAFLIIFSPVINFITQAIKKHENVETDDTGALDFNPFKLFPEKQTKHDNTL